MNHEVRVGKRLQRIAAVVVVCFMAMFGILIVGLLGTIE